MHLVQVPPDAVPKIWPLAALHIGKAIELTGGASSLDKELVAVTSGQKQLWMVIDTENAEIRNKAVASGITYLQLNADGTKTANIELFGGENMKAWFSLKSVFEDWAKHEGCKDIRMWARKGWAKNLPDFKLTHYILRKELT